MKKSCIAFAIMFLLISTVYACDERKDLASAMRLVDNECLAFSIAGGYYQESVFVKIQQDSELPRSAAIYYTLNGDTPSVESDYYAGPIELTLRPGEITVYPLKAVLYYKGAYSNVIEQTYVVSDCGDDMPQLPLVSITCSYNDLYNEQTGIFIHYDERASEWERPGHVMMFEADGTALLDQGVGIAVSGGDSARYSIKSLKLVGDYAYDGQQDKICLDLYADTRESPLSMVDTYNSIKLRSGSQDIWTGNIRSALMSRLASDSGFYGNPTSCRCMVYLNGEYQGVYDLQQNLTSSFIRRRFCLKDTSQVYTIKPAEATLFKYYEGGLLYRLFQEDLNDENNRAALEQYVDMQDYLLYCAIEVLINNMDWPQNNFRAWRYTGEYDKDNPYSDGRFRFIIYDTDLMYYREGCPEHFEGAVGDILTALMSGTVRAGESVFPNVMKSEHYRNIWLTMISDLMNTSFDTEHIWAVIDEEYEKIRPAMLFNDSSELLSAADYHISLMKLAVSEREETIEKSLGTFFSLKEKYHVAIDNAEGLSVSWNNMRLNGGERYENDYYKGTSFTISAKEYPGYSFSCWMVNGVKTVGKELTISADMAQNGMLRIEAVSEHMEGESLVISRVSANGSNDWFEISNVGTVPASLDQYWVSNAPNTDKRYSLPTIALEPASSLFLACKNNARVIGEYICGFSLKAGETLILGYKDTMIDQIRIPDMSAGESYGRYGLGDVLMFFDEERNS